MFHASSSLTPLPSALCSLEAVDIQIKYLEMILAMQRQTICAYVPKEHCVVGVVVSNGGAFPNHQPTRKS